MSRARIAALVLVNWKGVFYERYLLDRHVTALEGANGAGKTTVMIAAYVVLLPDMSKLRFTNLGETSAIGGDRGIWGRLGEPGRPSYAVLDLELADGERLVAGVRLTRAGEPTVEPTAFVITGLPPSVRLSDLLLVRRLDGDHVPQLDEIGEAVVRAGGAIEVFRTIKDYFAVLFERGVTPMRLAGDDERGKLNEMLRTSMTGGISRALTSELRGFLLKPEIGLGEALSRMRANLEACRRTRAEVAESRQLEREITAIYEAGAEMFAAAVHAARLTASEARDRVAAAQPAVDAALTTHRDREAEIAALEQRERELEARRGGARADLARATAERDRRTAVDAVTFRIAELDRELAAVTAAARGARTRQAAATAERQAAKHGREAAREAYDRASLGLAHLQQGLDELVRRAHGHRQLERRLAEARTLLGRPDLTAATAAAALAELDDRRARCEAERAGLDRELRDLEARRDEHARARVALEALDPGADGLPAGALHDRARTALARLAERDGLLGRGHELEREHQAAERLAARQHAARALGAELGLDARLGTAPAPGLAASELDAAERIVREAEDAIASARDPAVELRSRIAALRARLAALDDRLAAWHRAAAAAARLAGFAPAPASRAEAIALRDRLLEAQHALAARRGELAATRERTRLRAIALERAGAAVDPELIRLRDELGGELLAERFEDVDVASAGWVEARLGPLVDALIVDDPAAAAQRLAGQPRTAATVWLVGAGATLDLAPGDDPAAGAQLAMPDAAPAGAAPAAPAPHAGDVVCAEPFGVRVTRRPDPPSLGRRARERQVAELHAQIARDADALDALTAEAAGLAGWRRDADELAAQLDAWLAGDPADERAALESELAAAELALHGHDDRLRAAQARAAEARRRRDGLRRLLGDAALLDPPDHGARAAELSALRGELATARAELERAAPHRRVLGELVDALRRPPLDDERRGAAAARAGELAGELDRLFVARGALEDVLAYRHAAAWSDAEQALAAEASLAPALERQHADARAAAQAAEQAEAAADAAWDTATAAAHEADARCAAAAAHRERAAAELAALGGPLAAGDDHDQLVAAAIAHVNAIEAELRSLVTAAALATERRDQAARAAEDARTRLTAETRDAGPTAAAWAELRATADAAGLLASALAAAPAAGRTSIQLTADAWSKREVLLDRVTRARGGAELADAIRALALDGPSYLRAWQLTREWLRHRVPAQVVEVDEPLAALERLRSHLDVLEARLARQEHDLRGASEDVARGIDVQLRRAAGQIRRLNQQLDGIQFGSVRGIRIELRRIDRMEQILRALRLGEAQELLFLSAIPIEEALDEIFRRYGGGRAGGERLLDYREYLELAVQIRRQVAADWETASPTRLSTGEAIGVGAAVMMVVLTEWERDANLLRARRTTGSLRFLFLDEANRLSRDNLGVLFDLCKTLDLQLLIAAPEVARAEGNTTYRLVRHVTDDGREEVIVSGRRAAEPAPPLVAPPGAPPDAPPGSSPGDPA
ncbi:MAG TPA: chromosome partition protein MukB [Kofleriaceae bacterium]|nr:chromosome partition protein MukB [Kofleriaceae bacterium]